MSAAASADGAFPRPLERNSLTNCFGCGPGNTSGLRMRFTQLDEHSVETRILLERYYEGMDGVVHGGIQATLLDEVMAAAAELGLEGDEGEWCVTAELAVRYRRPVPITEEVVGRARLVSVDGPDLYVHGELVGPGDELLTTARSRWRAYRPED